jgi:uncharacterized protein (DUF1697 family)
MADLRALLSGLGYEDVRTHLNSGNAVVSARRTSPDRVAAKVQKALAEQHGLEAGCVARTGEELHAVIAGHPWPDTATDGSKMLAHFLSADPDPALLEAHDPRSLDPERIALGERVMYQWCPGGVIAAPMAAAWLEKHTGVVATGRNWNTVTKLAALLDS